MTVPDGYGINPYGAIVGIEQELDALRDALEDGDDAAVQDAIDALEEQTATAKTAVSARYKDEEWVPFEYAPEFNVLLERETNNPDNIRRRRVDLDEIPPAGDCE